MFIPISVFVFYLSWHTCVAYPQLMWLNSFLHDIVFANVIVHLAFLSSLCYSVSTISSLSMSLYLNPTRTCSVILFLWCYSSRSLWRQTTTRRYRAERCAVGLMDLYLGCDIPLYLFIYLFLYLSIYLSIYFFIHFYTLVD